MAKRSPADDAVRAIEALLDQRLFVLQDAQFDAFVEALDHSPAPGPKLRALMARKPIWEP